MRRYYHVFKGINAKSDILMRKRKVEGRGRGKERKRMRKKEEGTRVCWGPGFDSRLGRLRFFPFLPKLHFQFPFPSFPSSFFLILFLSFPLPLPSTLRLRIKMSLFAFIPLITILSGRARCTMATVTGSPSEAGLVCGHWIMPML